MRSLGQEMGMVDDGVLGLGSKIELRDENNESLFLAEWTGPEIIAHQRGGTGYQIGQNTLLLADVVFVGVVGLGLGLGAALIKRIWTE